MRRVSLLLFIVTAVFAADPPDLSQAQIDDIIQKFAAKEAEFAKARENYTYHQTARIQELDDAGNAYAAAGRPFRHRLHRATESAPSM